jgi:hypothetical protein
MKMLNAQKLTPEEKQSELKRHRDILLATIDYHLERTAGNVKFDQFDPSVIGRTTTQ